MPKLIAVGNKHLIIGSKLRANENAPEHGICDQNTMVTVKVFKNDGEPLAGLYSDRRISSWGNLDGLVHSRQGFWANRDCIMDCFELVTNNHMISKTFEFRKHNLKGLYCKILHTNCRTGDIFIELDKNVGGGGADGLGKTGHCIVIPHGYIVKKHHKKGEEVRKTWFVEEANND